MGAPVRARAPRRMVAAIGAIVTLLVLTACGARIDTVLTLNADGSGVRTMTLTLSTSDRDQYVTGGNEALDASIRRHKPEQLEYSGIQESETGVVTTFSLPFASAQEYRTKVAAILAATGDTTVPEIDLRIEDTLFLQGVIVDENFTSGDLLGWLGAGLVADGVVTEDNTDNVTEDGESSVQVDDELYSSYQPFSVEEVRDLGLKAVSMTTTIWEDGQVERQIDYTLGRPEYQTNPEAFDEFFRDATPPGGSLTAGDDKGGELLRTITFTVPSADIAAATSQALGGGDATFELTTSVSPDTPTTMVMSLSDSADCSAICSPDADSIADTLVVDDSWVPAAGYANTDADGRLVVEADTSSEQLTWERRLPIQAVSVATEISTDHAITQTVTIVVDRAVDDLTEGALEEQLAGTRRDALDVDRGDDHVTYTVTISGDSDKAHAEAAAASGLEGLEAAVYETEDDGFFRSAFRVWLYEPFEDEWGVATVTQTLSVPWAMSAELGSESGREITVTTNPSEAVVTGWKTAGLITLAILVVLLLAAVVAVVVLRTRIAQLWRTTTDRSRAARAQRAAMQASATPEAQPAAHAIADAGSTTSLTVATPDAGAPAGTWTESDLR